MIVDDNDPIYDEYFSFYDGISHLIRDDLDEFIVLIYQKLEQTTCLKMQTLLLSELNAPLLATNRHQERLVQAVKLVELCPDSGLAWKALARIYYHGNHNENNHASKNDQLKALEAWRQALSTENDLTSCHFIATDFCRALVELEKWDELQGIIIKLTEYTPIDVQSMDDVMPIENDWLHQCPKDFLEHEIVTEYLISCEKYMQLKKAFLQKKDLLGSENHG